MGCNFYKQIFHAYKKIKDLTEPAIIEKRNKLIEKVKIAIKKHDREYQEVYSTVHEIRLFDFLLREKISVEMHTDKTVGPDFICDLGYIECVSITKGKEENKHSFETIMGGTTNRYLAGESRITTALLEKNTKYNKYIEKNILDLNKSRIIAISTSILSNEVNHVLSSKLLQKILYGIDSQVVSIKNKEINDFYSYNATVRKGENQFKTAYFLDEKFKNISAVILNHNAFTEDINKNYFEICLNPNATIPLKIEKIQNLKYLYLKSKNEKEYVFNWHII